MLANLLRNFATNTYPPGLYDDKSATLRGRLRGGQIDNLFVGDGVGCVANRGSNISEGESWISIDQIIFGSTIRKLAQDSVQL
jgi:hypothetical protein